MGDAELMNASRTALKAGGGLILAALFTYAFQASAENVLTLEAFGAFGALWSAFFLSLIVSFLALEQTVAVSVARTGRAAGTFRQVSAMACVGGLVFLVTSLFVPGVDHWVRGVLMLGVLGYSLAYWIRGLLAGTGRMGQYGLAFASESLTRIAVFVTLYQFLSPWTSIMWAIGLAPWLTAAGWGLYLRTRFDQPPVPVSWRALTRVGVANLAFAAVLNSPPILALNALGEASAARIFASLVVFRVPIYLLQSVSSSLFSIVVGWTDANGPVAAQRRVLKLAGTAFAVGAVGAWLAAPLLNAIIGMLFSPESVPSDRVLIPLAIGVAAVGASMLLGPSLLVRHREVHLAVAWSTALALMMITMPNSTSETGLAYSFVAAAVLALIVNGLSNLRLATNRPTKKAH